MTRLPLRTVPATVVDGKPLQTISGGAKRLAVDPDAQASGIGTRLTEFALAWIKDAGFPVAMVGTGGDPGHAAARRTYEKAGMLLVPMARYFKRL